MALGLNVIAPIHLQVAGATLNLPFSGIVTVNSNTTGTGFGTFNIDSRDLPQAIAAGCWLHTNVDLQAATVGQAIPVQPSVISDGQVPSVIGSQCVVGQIIGANMNVTTDQQFAWTQGGKFIVTGMISTNPSLSMTTAAGGVYNATSKSGVIVAAATAYSNLTVATSAQLTLTAATNVWTYTAATMPYLSLTTGQGVAATADIYLIGYVIA
jgi:hypothetical protein